MSAVERPTDGPDTELAAAEAWFREDPKRLDFAPITEWSRHLRTIVRAYLARPDGAPQHLVRGDRVETADGVRATVTGPAPRGPNGEPAVNLDWDGDTGGPAYEHDLRRVPDATGGRDLTAADVAAVVRDYLGLHRTAQRLADRLNGIARPAVARTDGQPPANEPVRAVKRAYRDALWDLAQLWRSQSFWGGKYVTGEQVADHCVMTLMETLERVGKETPAAPADDTAAPDPRPQLRSVVAELSGLLDRAMNHDLGVEYIAQRRETYMSDLRRAEEAVADDSAAADRITAVKLLLDATTDPMDRAEAETHLDILGVTRAEVDEAKRLTAGQPVRGSQNGGE